MINGIPSRKTCLEQVQAINDDEFFLRSNAMQQQEEQAF